MSTKEDLMKQEALSIIKMGNISVINLVDAYKSFLRENNLVYEGKVLTLDLDVEPVINFTAEFKDWAFRNANILKNGVQIILLAGEGTDGDSSAKRSASRTRRQGRRSTRRKRDSES